MTYPAKPFKFIQDSHSATFGTGLFVGSLLLFALETFAARRIGPLIQPEQMALVRSLGGIALVVVLAGREGVGVCRTELPWLQLTRSVVSVAGLWTYYFAFSRLPLAEATALSYTKAFWLAICAVVILGERVNVLRWVAVFIAGSGAMVIVDPEHLSLGVASVAALGSALLSAALITLTKLLERRDRPITIMFYVATISFLAFVGPGILHWTSPAGSGWWLVAIAILGPGGQYLGIIALRSVDASVVAPLDYMRLIFAGALGHLILMEHPSSRSVVGSVMIVVGCLLASSSLRRFSLTTVSTPLKKAVARGIVRIS